MAAFTLLEQICLAVCAEVCSSGFVLHFSCDLAHSLDLSSKNSRMHERPRKTRPGHIQSCQIGQEIGVELSKMPSETSSTMRWSVCHFHRFFMFLLFIVSLCTVSRIFDSTWCSSGLFPLSFKRRCIHYDRPFESRGFGDLQVTRVSSCKLETF